MDMKFTLLLLAVGLVTVHGVNLSRQISRKISPKTAAALSEDGSSKLGMYGGKPTTIQKHPYLASVLYYGDFQCAATILSSSWVLTLGECTEDCEPDSLSVLVASQDSFTGQNYSVTNIVYHPQYGVLPSDYDYACLQVAGKFKWSNKVQPTKLPTKYPRKNTVMTVAGWGSTTPSSSGDNDSNTTILQGSMTWLTGSSREVCYSTYYSIEVLWTPRMDCVQHKGGTTLCLGDYGDAFIKNGVFYGMFSLADSIGYCTGKALPLLIANTYSVRYWLKSITGAKFEDE